MAIVIEDKNIIITLAPGTGSSALSEFIFTTFPTAKQLPETEIVAGGKVVCKKKHSTVRELLAAKVIDEDFVGNANVLTGIRNPFDFVQAEWYRMRTRWVGLLKKKDSWVRKSPRKIGEIIDSVLLDFPEYVKNKFGNEHEARIVNKAFVQEATHFLRMECLDQDLSTVFSEILGGISSLSFPRRMLREKTGITGGIMIATPGKLFSASIQVIFKGSDMRSNGKSNGRE